MSSGPSQREQLAVLTRGIADLHPKDEFERRLGKSIQSGRPLRVKVGFDPTAADLHLGHFVLIEKMSQFQRFGHEVTFLVGDYTALIGDPTGRNTLRPTLDEEEVMRHASTYTEQAFRILDRSKTQIAYNSTWLSKLSFKDIVALAAKYNLGRMLERRDFKQRFEQNQQICLHEFLYPLVQGYDSVSLVCDVELGGHDQIFNLNIGRHLMEAYGLNPQIVLTVPLLVGTDGIDKMSKSKGNHVGITEDPKSMFGKVMSISDATMELWIPLLHPDLADAAQDDPLTKKKALARSIVERFHDATTAENTRVWWDAGRPMDEDAPPIPLAPGPLFRLLKDAGLARSGNEARQKILQGGVSLSGERCVDPNYVLEPGTHVLRVGKKAQARVTVLDAPMPTQAE